MEKEKFASVNQEPSSNPNLSRDAAETLKLIQKKGLSISVVKSNSGLTPPINENYVGSPPPVQLTCTRRTSSTGEEPPPEIVCDPRRHPPTFEKHIPKLPEKDINVKKETCRAFNDENVTPVGSDYGYGTESLHRKMSMSLQSDSYHLTHSTPSNVSYDSGFGYKYGLQNTLSQNKPTLTNTLVKTNVWDKRSNWGDSSSPWEDNSSPAWDSHRNTKMNVTVTPAPRQSPIGESLDTRIELPLKQTEGKNLFLDLGAVSAQVGDIAIADSERGLMGLPLPWSSDPPPLPPADKSSLPPLPESDEPPPPPPEEEDDLVLLSAPPSPFINFSEYHKWAVITSDIDSGKLTSLSDIANREDAHLEHPIPIKGERLSSINWKANSMPLERPYDLQDKGDPHAPTVNGVLAEVIKELKTVLKQEICRRMFENTACKRLDQWWDEHLQKEKPRLAVKIIPAAPPQPVVKLFTYPPPPVTGGIAITNADLYCLNEKEYLNDQIIDFYLKYIFNEKLSDYHREKTHIFSSYFYERLTDEPDSRTRPGENVHGCSLKMKRHNQVKRWTRHLDIFAKDFIIVPVNLNAHWLLAIICYPSLVPEVAAESPAKPETPKINKARSNPNSDENSFTDEPDPDEPIPEAAYSNIADSDKSKRKKEVPCICIFDSLKGIISHSEIVKILRDYLEVEWKTKKGQEKKFDASTIEGYSLECPRQKNYSDCGLYLLQFVESFFENPLPYFHSPINWFPQNTISLKRQELTELILSLQKKYSESTSNETISTMIIRSRNECKER